MSHRAIIAETETLFSDLLSDYLARNMGAPTTTVIKSVKELSVVGSEDFDLALIDLYLADGSSLSWLRNRMLEKPRSHIITVTATTADYPLHHLSKCGVPGLVHKTDGLMSLKLAIETVTAGGAYHSPRIHELRAAFASDPVFFDKILSPREQEVLTLLGQGVTAEDIAQKLGVRVATCIDHRKTIMRKLGVHRQAELVAYALAKGFTRSP